MSGMGDFAAFVDEIAGRFGGTAHLWSAVANDCDVYLKEVISARLGIKPYDMPHGLHYIRATEDDLFSARAAALNAFLQPLGIVTRQAQWTREACLMATNRGVYVAAGSLSSKVVFIGQPIKLHDKRGIPDGEQIQVSLNEFGKRAAGRRYWGKATTVYAKSAAAAVRAACKLAEDAFEVRLLDYVHVVA